jgi:hypothetical protein
MYFCVAEDTRMKYMLMKTLMLLLMLFTTFVARAQDDVYFVPTKKNKANDVKGANEVYFVDVEEYLTDDDSHLSDSDSTYASYADDLLQQYDDSAYYAESSKGKIVPIEADEWADASETPTHAIVKFDSSHGGAYIGTIGTTLWLDNIKWVY